MVLVTDEFRDYISSDGTDGKKNININNNVD